MRICVVITDQSGEVVLIKGENDGKRSLELPARIKPQGVTADAAAQKIVEELGFSGGTLIDDGDGDYHYLHGKSVSEPTPPWAIVLVPVYALQLRAEQPQLNAVEPLPLFIDNRSALKVVLRLRY